jgi:hypothetical protein
VVGIEYLDTKGGTSIGLACHVYNSWKSGVF